MAKAVKTYLFCYDDHRNFSEDVKKRFSDQSRYKVVSFHNMDDFVNQLIKEKEHNFCKVAILGLQDTQENFEVIDHLTLEIKKIDRSTGVILLGPADKMEEIKKAIRLNIDSYIPRNANQVLRIHNTVKKLISEHSLAIYRKRRNFSFYFLLIFLAFAIILTIVAYFKFPLYF
jgi:DNA-binding NarL/FixJ family response regulator